jgi:hypothetical protein
MEKKKPGMKNCIFYAEAEKGHTLKVLIDVLAEFFTRLEISITKSGIVILRSDKNFSVCLNSILERDGFRGYICKDDLNISFSLSILQKLLKNVKKKESLIMYMFDDKNLFFDIRTTNATNKINSRSETISIQTQRVVCRSEESKAQPPPAECYYEPIVFDSCDFQKIKKLPYDGNGTIRIEMEESNYLKISDTSELYSSSLIFGEPSFPKDSRVYDKIFSKDTFKKIAKITGLHGQIHFHAPREEEYPNYPLFIKIRVGSFGKMEIYLKDNSQLEAETEEESRPD